MNDWDGWNGRTFFEGMEGIWGGMDGGSGIPMQKMVRIYPFFPEGRGLSQLYLFVQMQIMGREVNKK